MISFVQADTDLAMLMLESSSSASEAASRLAALKASAEASEQVVLETMLTHWLLLLDSWASLLRLSAPRHALHATCILCCYHVWGRPSALLRALLKPQGGAQGGKAAGGGLSKGGQVAYNR